MPPVTRFGETLERLRREGKVPSWRQLNAKLAELDDSRTADEWKAETNRYRRKNGPEPEEPRIRLYAKAIGIRRAEFPPAAPRLTVTLVNSRLEALAVEVAHLAKADKRVAGNLQRLQARLARLEARRSTGEGHSTGTAQDP